MNWSYRILAVIVVFVGGIMFLVYKSSTQKFEMVTTDYYNKELVYQNVIDAKNNANNLSDTIVYAVTGNQLKISFPKDFDGQKIDGEATLYYPSDESKDTVHQFSIENSSLALPLNVGDKKEFNLQIEWVSKGVSYFFERKLTIK